MLTATTFKGTLSGNSATATQLATTRTVDGVSFNGTANITHYGTCSTEAATAAKVVSLTGFTLATGAKIAVKFTVTNIAANPTLNVNGTGAKAIYYRGAAISAGYLAANRTYEFVYNGTQYELVGDLDTNTNTTYSAGTGLALSGTKFNHSNSVTAGTAQGDASKTLTFGGTFTIPTVTYDAQGHITAKGTTTMTMPANPNTDTKVVQTNTTTDANYRLLLSNTNDDTTRTEGSRKSAKFIANPSTGVLTATTFKGDLSGNATSATNASKVNGRHSSRIPTLNASGVLWDADAENTNDAFIQWDGSTYFKLKTQYNMTMVDNADMLDGYHAADFLTINSYKYGNVTYNTASSTSAKSLVLGFKPSFLIVYGYRIATSPKTNGSMLITGTDVRTFDVGYVGGSSSYVEMEITITDTGFNYRPTTAIASATTYPTIGYLAFK